MIRSRRHWWVVALAALLALGAGLWVRQAGERDRPNPAAPKMLFGTAFRDLGGGMKNLEPWRGNVLVVNFWATWCAPCREETPALVRIQQRYAANGVQVIGIAFDSAEKVQPFADEFRVNYPMLLAGAELFPLLTELGNRAGGLPFTVFVDRQGRIHKTHLGALDDGALAKILDPLAAK
ncbi:MAG: TlpA family protein disulfide reductase [Burkholderiales bacterium]|nr:TlpA family protein disulfide reductase [Burkholderiales bacterium]